MDRRSGDRGRRVDRRDGRPQRFGRPRQSGGDAAPGYCYRDYGCESKLIGRQLETWADAFSAWVYASSFSEEQIPPDGWIYDGREPNWDNIFYAVETSLTDEFSP